MTMEVIGEERGGGITGYVQVQIKKRSKRDFRECSKLE